MFKQLRELSRNKFTKIHLFVGDTLNVTWRDEKGEKVLCTHSVKADQVMVIDESMILEGEVDGRRAFAGVVIEETK